MLALISDAQILAPTVVNSAGGIAQNSSINVEWSLGELAVNSLASPSNLLTQGFLQPIVTIVGITDLFESEQLAVFPNPVVDWLNIQGDIREVKTIRVYNALGGMVMEVAFSALLDLSQLGAGHYVVCLFNPQNQRCYAFKINKI